MYGEFYVVLTHRSKLLRFLQQYTHTTEQLLHIHIYRNEHFLQESFLIYFSSRRATAVQLLHGIRRSQQSVRYASKEN